MGCLLVHDLRINLPVGTGGSHVPQLPEVVRVLLAHLGPVSYTHLDVYKRQKQLRVWLSPEKYDALKEKAHTEGTSIYALVNRWVDAYLQETPEA